jgi:SH3-like domain-containing protein
MKGTPLVLGLLLMFAALPFDGVAQAQQVCIKSPRANLRAGPGKNFRITWEVNRYMPLIQIEKKGDWVKVKDVDGDTHWVYQALVSGNLDCITIQSSKANIRKGPTTRADKWFTVQKYTSFKRVGRKSKWVKIEYEGQAMWVYYTLVWPQSS